MDLRSVGASEDFLHAWENGWELAAVEAPTRFHNNKWSLVEYIDWAEEKSARAEEIREIRCLEDSTRPALPGICKISGQD